LEKEKLEADEKLRLEEEAKKGQKKGAKK